MPYRCRNCKRFKDGFCSYIRGEVHPMKWGCVDIEVKGEGYCEICGEISDIHIEIVEKQCYCLKCARKTINKWLKQDPKLEISLKSEFILLKKRRIKIEIEDLNREFSSYVDYIETTKTNEEIQKIIDMCYQKYRNFQASTQEYSIDDMHIEIIEYINGDIVDLDCMEFLLEVE